jgi:hypothetical protein
LFIKEIHHGAFASRGGAFYLLPGGFGVEGDQIGPGGVAAGGFCYFVPVTLVYGFYIAPIGIVGANGFDAFILPIVNMGL